MSEATIVERSKGIYLRKITESDTDNIVRWRNSDGVRLRFIDQRLFTPESHNAWLSNYVNTGKAEQLIICISPEFGKQKNVWNQVSENEFIPVGSVYIRDISLEHKKAEYGIFIGEESARGCGVGSRAAEMMIHYCFETLKLHRLFLRVYADNTAAIKSYENAGFKREALLRDDVLVNGKYHDIVLMGILNPAD